MDLKKTGFTAMLIQANEPNAYDLQHWVFCPGMCFSAADKWWGDHGRRDFPHEGIDLCLYRDRHGRIGRIDEQTRIPALHAGVIRAVFSDYLGKAVIIDHSEDLQAASGPLISVYAHTRPLNGIQAGRVVSKGEIIATIADTRHSKAKILPHLHLTLANASPGLEYDPFVWNKLRDPDTVTLLNPESLIDWPCQVLDAKAPGCLNL